MGRTSKCPGCGLQMPSGPGTDPGYYHASPECMSLYTEVLGVEFGNAVLFGQVHSLTVDSYAVQHAGGEHEAKSVSVHLVGLLLVLEGGIGPMGVAPRLKRLADRVQAWPELVPPQNRGSLTVIDVALASGALEHAERVRAWAREQWEAWKDHHDVAASLAADHGLLREPACAAPAP